MKVEFEISGTYAVELKQKDIEEIAIYHKGDIKAYLETMDIDYDEVSYKVDSMKYNIEKINTNLLDYKKENGLNDNFERDFESINIKKIKNISFEILDIMKKENELKNTIIFDMDKELMKKIVYCADDLNPKKELETIYFGNEHIVATNTRVLFQTANITDFKELYIPKEYMKAYIFYGAKLSINQHEKYIYLEYEDFCFKFDFKELKYVDYKKISTRKMINSKNIEMKDFLDNAKIAKKDGVELCIYELNHEKRKYICFHNSYIDTSMKYITIEKYDYPIKLEDNENSITMMIMPIIMDSDEDAEKLIGGNNDKS